MDRHKYYLIETVLHNNHLVAVSPSLVPGSGLIPGDTVTKTTELDITLAEFAALANQAITQTLTFDTMSGKVIATPKNMQESNDKLETI